MKLTFLGTRGYIEPVSRRHRKHTSVLVSYKRKKIMIDCGENWLDQLEDISPHAIVVTHAHPDHAGGLKNGAPCPVYAPEAAWEELDDYPIDRKRPVEIEKTFRIGELHFTPYSVEHSTRAPAVGYKVTAGKVTIFYVPDLVYIHERSRALAGARVYIGDGATLTRPLVRKRGDRLIGHSPFRTQLTWCQKEGVPMAIVTHCGSEIVDGDERSIIPKLEKMAEERGVSVQIAHDGMELVLR